MRHRPDKEERRDRNRGLGSAACVLARARVDLGHQLPGAADAPAEDEVVSQADGGPHRLINVRGDRDETGALRARSRSARVGLPSAIRHISAAATEQTIPRCPCASWKRGEDILPPRAPASISADAVPSARGGRPA